MKKKNPDALSDIIVASNVAEKLHKIATATTKTKYNRGVYKYILIHGPRGTSKTMFAKKLAEYSGMDYAIVRGSEFAPAGRERVRRLFDWSQTSKNGLVLFINKAEFFSKNKSIEYIPREIKIIQNMFRHHRVLRDRIIRLYFKKFVLQPAIEDNKRLKVSQFDYTSLYSKMANLTEGMSGRDIMKLKRAWQAAASNDELTEKGIMDIYQKSYKHYKREVELQNEQKTSKVWSICPV